MKKIIYIFSVIFLGLLACTDENLGLDTELGGAGLVTMHFTLEDIPDFQIATKAAGESSVGNLSLMTFDKDGNFLGRVVASNMEQDKEGTGTGTVSVPKMTTSVHFIANYNWDGTEYVTPNGEKEKELMPFLTSSASYVAWGQANVVDFNKVSVKLLRNYAKVTVTSERSDKNNFEVGGFALANYVSKGTVVTYGEEGDSFVNVTDDTNANTKITQVNDYSAHMQNQISRDCQNADAKYMFEYNNNYDSQTCVIIKKKDANQYYKIQLLDTEGNPFIIERNYEYKVIIKLFVEEAKGSPSFEEALKAAPTNNIFAEITKEAPTVSDSEKNKLTVSPLFHLFTSSGSLAFDANYWAKGTTLNNNDLLISLIQNGHGGNSILQNLSTSIGGEGKVTATVSVNDGISKLDSATVLVRVKGKMLSRVVTVYVSPQYSFTPTTGSGYSKVGDQVTLKFNIPDNYPTNLYPVKCYIKAEDLNPDKSRTEQLPMLIEQKNNTYYYVYEATQSGEQTVYFKTTRSAVTNPTVSNDYFATAEFNMERNIPVISGTLKYATGDKSSTAINGSVKWEVGNNLSGEMDLANGKYSLNNLKVENSDEVTFTYTRAAKTKGSVDYKGVFKVSDLKNKAVVLNPIRIVGPTTDFTSGATVNKWNKRKGDKYGELGITDNTYTYTLPQSFNWTQIIRMNQGYKKSAALTISEWVQKDDLTISKE